jgi:glycine/D-amino acid oxidase-like deaminating enzyme
MPGKSCDLLIIGGGFAGTALAYHAAKAGAEILLLEAGELCSGTSGACTGRAQVIESETEAYLDLVLSGFSKLEGLAEELDLEWELPGHLTLIYNEMEWQSYEALTHRLNRRGVPAEMLDRRELLAAVPGLMAEGCLGAAYSQEGRLNPFKFCLGYARAAARHGARLRTRTTVSGFVRQRGRITRVWAGNEDYSIGTVVLAAGAWTGTLAEMAGSHLPMRFTRAEALVSEPLPPFIRHHIGMSGFYEAVHGAQRAVTLGLGQVRSGALVVSNAIQQAETIDRTSSAWGLPAISRGVSHLFPGLKGVRIVRTWAAPSPFLPDYLPAIGWLPGVENLYVAAGFHLAVPTIPALAEAVACSALRSETESHKTLLRGFSPERFSISNRLASHDRTNLPGAPSGECPQAPGHALLRRGRRARGGSAPIRRDG